MPLSQDTPHDVGAAAASPPAPRALPTTHHPSDNQPDGSHARHL